MVLTGLTTEEGPKPEGAQAANSMSVQLRRTTATAMRIVGIRTVVSSACASLATLAAALSAQIAPQAIFALEDILNPSLAMCRQAFPALEDQAALPASNALQECIVGEEILFQRNALKASIVRVALPNRLIVKQPLDITALRGHAVERNWSLAPQANTVKAKVLLPSHAMHRKDVTAQKEQEMQSGRFVLSGATVLAAIA